MAAAMRPPFSRRPPTDVRGLDPVLHAPIRLGIATILGAARSRTFVELKELLDATDGNLSVHARKLEEAGYVACAKGYDGRVPRTLYRLTAKGRKALLRYLDGMEALICAARRR
jgi:DNA-binding MarR family transcriptional regulator